MSVRKTVATIGLVTALAVFEPIATEAGGNMRGQQWRGPAPPADAQAPR